MMPATLGNIGVMLSYILGFWFDWSQLSLAGAVNKIPFWVSHSKMSHCRIQIQLDFFGRATTVSPNVTWREGVKPKCDVFN